LIRFVLMTADADALKLRRVFTRQSVQESHHVFVTAERAAWVYVVDPDFVFLEQQAARFAAPQKSLARPVWYLHTDLDAIEHLLPWLPAAEHLPQC
jgi:hypothetical protein